MFGQTKNVKKNSGIFLNQKFIIQEDLLFINLQIFSKNQIMNNENLPHHF